MILALSSFQIMRMLVVLCRCLVRNQIWCRLRNAILKTFKGRQISIEELRDWVITETEFLPKHLKGPVLAPMEKAGEVSVVNASAKRRKGTFSDGTILEFS